MHFAASAVVAQARHAASESLLASRRHTSSAGAGRRRARCVSSRTSDWTRSGSKASVVPGSRTAAATRAATGRATSRHRSHVQSPSPSPSTSISPARAASTSAASYSWPLPPVPTWSELRSGSRGCTNLPTHPRRQVAQEVEVVEPGHELGQDLPSAAPAAVGNGSHPVPGIACHPLGDVGRHTQRRAFEELDPIGFDQAPDDALAVCQHRRRSEIDRLDHLTGCQVQPEDSASPLQEELESAHRNRDPSLDPLRPLSSVELMPGGEELCEPAVLVQHQLPVDPVVIQHLRPGIGVVHSPQRAAPAAGRDRHLHGTLRVTRRCLGGLYDHPPRPDPRRRGLLQVRDLPEPADPRWSPPWAAVRAERHVVDEP